MAGRILFFAFVRKHSELEAGLYDFNGSIADAVLEIYEYIVRKIALFRLTNVQNIYNKAHNNQTSTGYFGFIAFAS